MIRTFFEIKHYVDKNISKGIVWKNEALNHEIDPTVASLFLTHIFTQHAQPSRQSLSKELLDAWTKPLDADRIKQALTCLQKGDYRLIFPILVLGSGKNRVMNNIRARPELPFKKFHGHLVLEIPSQAMDSKNEYKRILSLLCALSTDNATIFFPSYKGLNTMHEGHLHHKYSVFNTNAGIWHAFLATPDLTPQEFMIARVMNDLEDDLVHKVFENLSSPLIKSMGFYLVTSPRMRSTSKESYGVLDIVLNKKFGDYFLKTTYQKALAVTPILRDV